MTTLLPAQTQEREVRDATPGCGCCIPPPDAAEARVAELEARRERLERRLRRIDS